jgi:hypothetical protein
MQGLGGLDAMVDARLVALERRATEGAVSFSFDGPAGDPELEHLWQMVEHARGDGDEPVSFAGDADEAPASEGLVARVARELMGIVRDASQQAVVSRPHVRTRVGWTGTVVTHAAPGLTAAEVEAHAAEVAAAVETSAHRLRLVSLVLVAAGKIAALIAVPGAAVTALPIAYRCVRDVYEQWRASSAHSSTGGTAWRQRK